MATRRQHQDYTVGWICPLEVEQTAALEMLDEMHDPLPQPRADRNVYTLGSINGHDVVVAGLPQTGNRPAAAMVTQLRNTFPEIKFCLLVGIGGGVPTRTDAGSIRLGDVVVSKPMGDHSGAIQYDHGKAEVHQFKRTGTLNRPPDVLLNAAQDLAAKRARTRRDPIVTNFRRIDTSIPGLSKYRYPGRRQDRLFPADFIHPHPQLSCLDAGCEPFRISCGDGDDEDEDDDDDPRVVVHRGTIASGELVVKNGLMRDDLAKEFDVLCFETEAAGAMLDFPCLVVRGISDYCDSHKNNEWHGYAAGVAAAYARQLFFHLPIQEVKQLQRAGTSSIEEKLSWIRGTLDDSKKDAILRWLSPSDYSAQQSDFISNRQEGTGNWIFQLSAYQQWLTGDGQTLFCPGIPGSGKTMIAAIVIEQLLQSARRREDIGVAYVYCNFRERTAARQKPENILASLTRQLAQQRPHLPESLVRAYQDHKKNFSSFPAFGELSDLLRSVASGFSKTYIVIDALDEYHETEGDRRRLLSELRAIQQKTGCTNLFATSRFIPDIQERFEHALKIEIRAKSEDIHRFLEGDMATLPSFVAADPVLQREVKESIVNLVDGMFLLAKLHLHSLRGKRSPKQLRKALENLPRGTDAYDFAYMEAMARIEGQVAGSRELAKDVLSWIACAKQPLTTRELQYALAVELDESTFDEENLPSVTDMVSACAGLVTVDELSDIIRLVHYTTQEYFERTWKQWFPHAHTQIALSCLSYLLLTDISLAPGRFFHSYKHPPFEYMARNWGAHACSGLIGTHPLIFELLDDKARFEICSKLLFKQHVKSQIFINGYLETSPVHVIAWFGLAECLSTLIARGWDVHRPDHFHQTPLSYAAWRGHVAVVQLLASLQGVDLNHRGMARRTPLMFAAVYGQDQVVQFLLGLREVDRNLPDDNGRTPLWWAAEIGIDKVVRLLLADGRVDADRKGDHGHRPLMCAAKQGHLDIAKQLLSHNQVNINARDDYGQTPFFWAVKYRNERVIALFLMRTDLDPNIQDESGQTPIHWTVLYREEVTFLQLLRHPSIDADRPNKLGRTPLNSTAVIGYDMATKYLLANPTANPNSKDCYGRSPLANALQNEHCEVATLLLQDHRCYPSVLEIKAELFEWAARAGHAEMIKRLLSSHMIDPNVRNEKGTTGLWMAARNGHVQVVQMLLRYQETEINVKDCDGQTPLSKAAENGHFEIVKLLLMEDGINLNDQDKHGRTPLSLAVANGHLNVVKVLLEDKNTNPNMPDDRAQTPLAKAAERGQRRMVEALLSRADVKVNLTDRYRYTPLLWGAENGELAIVELLLRRDGIDINAISAQGDTALAKAAGNGNAAITQTLLLEAGIDADPINKYGLTPLLQAATAGHEECVKLLLRTGRVNPNAQDRSGQTALSKAAEAGHTLVVQTLLRDAGVDRNLSERDESRTPLWLASDKGHFDIVDLLLKDAAVDPNIANYSGQTPLSRAAQKGFRNIVKVLLGREDVDMTAEDSTGRTALLWAIENGHKKVEALFT